jgi:roundabout, axon guidance receptor 2
VNIAFFFNFSIIAAPPYLTIRPTPQSVEMPGDVSFECKAVGKPEPIIFWSIEGNRTMIFPGQTYDRFQSSWTQEQSTVLTMAKTMRSDNGIIVVCSAINSVSSVIVKARLSVSLPDNRPPPIILLGPSNQTLPVKSVAVLMCKASGYPTPIISWYRDGNPVVSSDKVNITESGTLVISELDKESDQGLYTCVASSKSGKYTWNGYLKLESPTNPNIKFYRAPETSMFPSAPGKPQIINVTEDSITISWLPSIKSGASDIFGYSIEMFSVDMAKGWIPMASKIREPVYIQSGLTSGATYVFIVRAENTHGVSPSSPMSEQIITGKDIALDETISLSEAQASLSSGNIVKLLEANATESTTVRLLWELVNGKFVEGFYIYAHKTRSKGSYKMLTILHGGGASACTVADLDKFTEYDFFLVPFYKSIEGRPSNSRHAVTLEDGKRGYTVLLNID